MKSITPEQHKSLHRAYKRLDRESRFILMLLAVAGEPLDNSSFENSLSRVFSNAPKAQSIFTKQPLVSLRKLAPEFVIRNAGKCRVKPENMSFLMREAAKEELFSEMNNAVQWAQQRSRWTWDRGTSDFLRLLRDARIAFYKRSNDFFHLHSQLESNFPEQLRESKLAEELIGNPFDEKEFAGLAEGFRGFFYFRSMFELWKNADCPDYMVQISKIPANPKGSMLTKKSLMNFQIQAFRGEFDRGITWVPGSPFSDFAIAEAMVAYIKGDESAAISKFQEAWKYLRKETGKRNIFFSNGIALFYALALLKTRDLKKIESLKKIYKDASEGSDFRFHFELLRAVGLHLQLDLDASNTILEEHADDWEDFALHFGMTYVFVLAVAHLWCGKPVRKEWASYLESNVPNLQAAGFRWLELELSYLLAGHADTTDKKVAYRARALALKAELGIEPIADLLAPEAPWRQTLRALAYFGKDKQAGGASTEGTERLIWLFDYDAVEKVHSVRPVLQKQNKSGKWTKGRDVAMKRIFNRELECMQAEDLRVAECVETIQERSYRSNGKVSFELDFGPAMIALAGHPLVFLEEAQNTPVEISRAEPEFIVRETPSGYVLTASVWPEDERDYILLRESPTRFKVIHFTDAHRNMFRAMNGNHLEVPADGKSELLDTLNSIAHLVNVHSEIEEVGVSMEQKEAETQLYMHLLPHGDGFRMELLVKPLGLEGPSHPPAQGGTHVIAKIGSQVFQARRDLEKEEAAAREMIAASPSLSQTWHEGAMWTLPDAEACLTALLDLSKLREDGDLILQWPKGEKLRLLSRVGTGDLSLHIDSGTDWFALDGKLQIDPDTFVEIRELLEWAANSDSQFIQLDEGKFVALTRQLRRSLEDAAAVVQNVKGQLRVHARASGILNELAVAAGSLRASKKWEELLKKQEDVRNYHPEVPTTLKAQLRSYQLEGFRWLARLGKLGVGACLADDMGLGKTLQSIAVILDRAPEGPALVIAPASVTRNWASEARKFAPALNPILFSEGDRGSIIENLGPFDLLISTYGLLTSSRDLLTAPEWTTIVLDEAQAIKNANTKRSKAAMDLKSGFRIITTGTPVENHLGELWNLFQFINPGLLGSIKRFNERFALPIERDGSDRARRQLHSLVQPFLLRRLKHEVLDELPPKTEITLEVDFSPEEAAFYEAVRTRALEKVDASGASGGQKQMTILAELTRLRQACCHPRLVDPKSVLGSSKLELFGEIVSELRDSGHKALVFSQFVGHLGLVRALVEAHNIPYQYLDGSTPAKLRQKRILDFQSGKGDLFLISLRAGGTGLNLTAADYVIHMDPWWNPAVEDQASDRAHRIGQERPVTIYRLITRNTVEEKIVKLHATKRDLADSLLQGTDRAARMGMEELLQLMKETSSQNEIAKHL